ncbi:MAG: putative exonuclease [Chlamydiales bacterium]|jgi:DNA polymerase-3 subunit epsilon/oligoribonuclease|nr:putative exonuclease [Chlamydiales bacterium]
MLGIFLDLETNGLDPYRHRILEIAFKIFDIYTGELKVSFESIVYQPDDVWKASNIQSLGINGFTQDLVAKGRLEKDIASEIINYFTQFGIKRNQAVFICQNPSFDRMFFYQLISPEEQMKMHWPYHWLDLASMYWAFRMQDYKNLNCQKLPPISLSKDQIAAHHGLPKESAPHKAMNGVNHLIQCYEAIVGFPLKNSSFAPTIKNFSSAILSLS